MAGVMFVGRVPPKGYEAKPGGRYRLPDDPLAGTAAPRGERRHHERLQIFVNLRLRRLGTSGTMEEQTVTENVCRGGARVFTTLPVSAGEALSVADLDDRVATEAVVRHVFVGPDRVTRLNLHFPDLAGFDRLLQAAGVPSLPGRLLDASKRLDGPKALLLACARTGDRRSGARSPGSPTVGGCGGGRARSFRQARLGRPIRSWSKAR